MDKFKEEKKDSGEKLFAQIFAFATELGIIISLPIAGGALLGYWGDRILGSAPKLTLSFLFTGLAISFFMLYKSVKKYCNGK